MKYKKVMKHVFTPLFIFSLVFFMFSCSNERATQKGTVKLFIKYATEKNMKKIYEMLTPDSKRRYMKSTDHLIRSDFQVNKYNVKSIRFRSRDQEKELYHMEIVLKDGESGFLTLKKIEDVYYIELN